MEIVDVSIKWPFKWTLVGSSGSGKTNFSLEIVKNSQQLFDLPPTKIIIVYKVFQDIYKYFNNYINTSLYAEDEVDFEELTLNNTERLLIICDDLYFSKKLNEIAEQFLIKGRHRNTSWIVLTQSIFNQPALKNISRNSSHITLFKSVRLNEPHIFFSQLRPKSSKVLQNIYAQATEKSYSYLDIDLSQTCPDKLRYKTNIFNKFIPVFIIMTGDTFKTMYLVGKSQLNHNSNDLFKLSVQNKDICDGGMNVSVKPIKPRSKKYKIEYKTDTPEELDPTVEYAPQPGQNTQNEDDSYSSENYDKPEAINKKQQTTTYSQPQVSFRNTVDEPTQLNNNSIIDTKIKYIPIPLIDHKNHENKKSEEQNAKENKQMPKQGSLDTGRRNFRHYPFLRANKRKPLIKDVNSKKHNIYQNNEFEEIDDDNLQNSLNELRYNFDYPPQTSNVNNAMPDKNINDISKSLIKHQNLYSERRKVRQYPPMRANRRKPIIKEVNNISRSSIEHKTHENENPEQDSLDPSITLYSNTKRVRQYPPMRASKRKPLIKEVNSKKTFLERMDEYGNNRHEKRKISVKKSAIKNIASHTPPMAGQQLKKMKIRNDLEDKKNEQWIGGLKSRLNARRVQFKRKKDTVGYRIVPDDAAKSLLVPSDFTFLDPRVSQEFQGRWKPLSELKQITFKNKRFKPYRSFSTWKKV
jgi:hypothetical protein